MEQMHIRGGYPLHGSVTVSGSKNAALPILAATLLTDEPVILESVPRLSDVDTMSELLGTLGASLTRWGTGAVQVCVHDRTNCEADAELVRRMRASFCVLGPLLARRGRASLPLPGGCQIGERPIDLHLKGLRALGAQIDLRGDHVIASATRLRGADVSMAGSNGSTVTGTCNVLSAAVLAEGNTTIRGAAREPEVVDLGQFLLSMGAKIDGLGTSTVRVTGVKSLQGTTHRVIADRIEVATWLCATAITGGEIEVCRVRPDHLTRVLSKLRDVGANLDVSRDRIHISCNDRLRAVDVVAAPYPEIPTDIQAQLTAVLSVAGGMSTIHDTVFPERLQHVTQLARMGATLRIEAGSVRVVGVRRLTGAHVTATDLRASAALVLAALSASGETVIHQIYHLDRGYERLDQKLESLGADVRRASIAAGRHAA